jgi:hypothetical protein
MAVRIVFPILIIVVVTALNVSLYVLPDFIKYARNGGERWRRHGKKLLYLISLNFSQLVSHSSTL